MKCKYEGTVTQEAFITKELQQNISLAEVTMRIVILFCFFNLKRITSYRSSTQHAHFSSL